MKSASLLDRIFGGAIAQLAVITLLGWFGFEWWQGRLHWILLGLPILLFYRVDQSRRRVQADREWQATRFVWKKQIRGGGKAASPARKWLLDAFIIYPGLLLCGFLLAAYALADRETQADSLPIAILSAVGALGFGWLAWRQASNAKQAVPERRGTEGEDFRVTCVVPFLPPPPHALDTLDRLPPDLELLLLNGLKAKFDKDKALTSQ